MDIIERIKSMKQYYLLFVLSISLIIRILFLVLDYPLWWDSDIYILIGKYIFSSGELGVWEPFRPLVHPLILGGLWKINIDPFIAGKILDVVFSLTAIYLTFRIAASIYDKHIAFLSSLIFSLTAPFILFTGIILTEPLAITLGLLGILFILGKKSASRYALAGIFFGLSFMTKFPQGIWLAGVFISILLAHDTWRNKIKDVFSISFGFSLPVIPFLIFNLMRYADALYPFTTGSWIVGTATWLYGSGITYYFTEFFLKNAVYILFFVYAYQFFKKQEWNDLSKSILFIIPALTILYFLTVPRKEVRYLVTIIPFLAITASVSFFRLYHWLKKQPKPAIRPNALFVLFLIFLLLPLPFGLSVERVPEFNEEIRSVVLENDIDGLILTSSPSFVSFLDNRIKTLDGVQYAATIYRELEGEYELLIISTCDLPCAPADTICLNEKEDFFKTIDLENTRTYTSKISLKNQECTFSIHLPNN